MAHFHQITIRGETFTFDHLESTDLTVTVKSGKTTRDIVIVVNFGCHCFTEKHDPAIHTPDLIYRHDGEIRTFDYARYALSKALPDIIRRIPGRKVFFSRETNYLTIETVDAFARNDVHFLHIFNLLGQQVWTGKTAQQIDVSALKEGKSY